MEPALFPVALLTPDEVGVWLACSRNTVYDLAAAGRLPAVRLSPRMLRFRRSDVEAYIESVTAPAVEPSVFERHGLKRRSARTPVKRHARPVRRTG